MRAPFLLVFGLPPDVVAATLGDVGIEEVVSLSTGVSPVCGTLASLFHVITSYLSFRSRTTWLSVSTGVSRSATSRGVIRPRPSNSPVSRETLSPSSERDTHPGEGSHPRSGSWMLILVPSDLMIRTHGQF